MNIRRSFFGFFGLTIISLLLALLLVACSDEASPTSPPTSPTVGPNGGDAAPTVAANPATPGAYKADKTFIFGLAQEPVAFNDQVGLDPANLTDHSSLLLVRQIYETLLQFKPTGMGFQGGSFVRSFSVSDDGLTYTFKLFRGIRFSDGSILDANVVKFNFERWSKFGVYHKGDFQTWSTFFGGFPGDVLDSVEARDDNITVVVKLKRPLASLYQILAMPQFGIVSPTSFDSNGYFARPVGSGPYMAEKPVRGEVHYVVLKANPHYLQERDPATVKAPVLNQIVAQVLKPGQDGLSELKRGTISATDKIRPEDVPEARQNPSLTILERDPLNIAFLSLNQARAPFNLKEVRQAFAYAINVRGLVNKLYNGLGRPASTFLPPAAYGSLTVDPYPYDPDRAKQLLASVGYSINTFPALDLWVLPVPRSYYPDPAKIAAAIKSDLALIGVTVNIHSEKEWPSFREDREQGKFNFFMNGWQGSNGDPDEFLGNFFGQTKAEDGYENLLVQDLIKRGRETSDLAQRRQLYKQAQEYIFDDFAVIPLAYTSSPVALRPEVKGYQPHPSGQESWATVSFGQK
jgi:peptide/nickel transport system substrate-binding protein